MDFECIRAYLASDPVLAEIVGDNLFLFECPEQVKCDDYIVYNPKEMGAIGGGVQSYQLDIRAISKDKLRLMELKYRLVYLLDNAHRATPIEGIRKIRLINGGGIAKADNGEYNAFLYFYVII